MHGIIILLLCMQVYVVTDFRQIPTISVTGEQV